tara:strand:+ start:448 stop:1002 length:555 start_codon:yes stop_codon:yes gene_type:complete
MASKLKTDILETVSGSGTIALTNQLSGMTDASMPSGSVVQKVNTQTGVHATSTVTMPFDNTIPQITEGTEFLSVAITPKSSSNILFIEVVMACNTAQASGNGFTHALFVGTTANALASMGTVTLSEYLAPMAFNHRVVAGTTNALTFRVRSGGGASGTTQFNGFGGARFGGTFASSITITEIKG